LTEEDSVLTKEMGYESIGRVDDVGVLGDDSFDSVEA
jgi:hypothetical protein